MSRLEYRQVQRTPLSHSPVAALHRTLLAATAIRLLLLASNYVVREFYERRFGAWPAQLPQMISISDKSANQERQRKTEREGEGAGREGGQLNYCINKFIYNTN